MPRTGRGRKPVSWGERAAFCVGRPLKTSGESLRVRLSPIRPGQLIGSGFWGRPEVGASVVVTGNSDQREQA
jgi:hypothetical protein